MSSPVISLSAAEVAEHEQAVRSDLSGAIAHLAVLREGRADEAAGFGTWGEYLLARFGDLLAQLRLGREDRDAAGLALRVKGATTRELREALGVSSWTVDDMLKRHGDPAPERVTGADGASRPSRTGRGEEAAEGPLWARALVVVVRRGRKGITLVELARALSITEGSASGLLTYLGPADRRHPQRKGAVVRTEERRNGQRVHVAVPL